MSSSNTPNNAPANSATTDIDLELSKEGSSPSSHQPTHNGDPVLDPSKEHPPLSLDPSTPDRNTSRSPSLTTTKSITSTLPLTREILFVGTVVLAQFTTQVGLGQTLALLNVLGTSFHITSPASLSWLIAGYSLTVGSFILISGRFGDLFGYKVMFVLGMAWFSVWSMVAGLSVYSDDVLFIFARVLSGIGPAVTLPNGLALLGAAYERGRRKDMVFAIFGATAPGGAVVGAVFAGIFNLAWWPWAFWSFAITLAIIAVVAVYVIPNPPLEAEVTRMSLREKLVALDMPGAVVGITALVVFNFAWNQAPIVGWPRAYVWVTLIIGALLIPVFFYIELRWAPKPLIPFDALSVDVAFVLACVSCGWASFGIWVYYLWTFLLNFKHKTPLLAAAMTVPLAISGACAAICTGILLGKLRPCWIMVIALCCFLTGNILVGTAPVGQIYWAQLFVATIVMPWGMDMSFPAATIVLSNAVDKKHQGIAASLVNTVVNYSISLGLGFAGTVQRYEQGDGTSEEAQLHGLRSGYYMGFALAGMGVGVSLIFVAKDYMMRPPKKG